MDDDRRHGFPHQPPLCSLKILFIGCALFLIFYVDRVQSQKGSSMHWPMAFVAKGHADEWNATSIVYYDWKQRAMRRDTILAYPPSHFNPETGQVELTKQPALSSFIWKDDKLYLLYSDARNGWGNTKCTVVKAPKAVPPPYWMDGMALDAPSSGEEEEEGRGGGWTYYQCHKVKTYRGESEWDRKVQTMFITDITFDSHFEYVYDVVKHTPLRIGYEGHKGFVLDSFEDHEFWDGIDSRAFDTSAVNCKEVDVTVHAD